MKPAHPERFDVADSFGGGTSRIRYLWLVGLAVYVAAIWYVGWRRIGSALATVDLGLLAALMAVEAAALGTRAMKWRLVLGPDQSAFKLFFLSKAAGGWSPGRVGELAPLLLRKHRTPRMAAWIVVDRLLEVAATLGLGLVGLIALQRPTRGMLVTILIALAVLVVAPVYVLTRRAFFLWLAGYFREESLIHRGCMLVAAMSDEIVGLRKWVPVASALTVLASCLDVCVGILLYLSFEEYVSFFLIAVVQCAHGIASAIPLTPNATGVPYLVAAGLLYTIAGIPKEVLAAAVGVRMAAVNAVFWTSFGSVMARRAPQPERQDQGALFDRLAAGSLLYRYGPEALDRLKGLVPPRGRVLDVGCGDGTIAAALGIERVMALDLSPGCAQLAAGRGVPVVVGDAVAGLPFAANAFDIVCCFDVLHHLGRAWDEVITELDGVLRPGGTLVIVEPDAENPVIRWTQAPDSPIRTAPSDDEPAIYASELLPHLGKRGYVCECRPIHVEGEQVERAVFPLWQRLLKAPAVLLLAWWFRHRPNKFAIVAHKREETP